MNVKSGFKRTKLTLKSKKGIFYITAFFIILNVIIFVLTLYIFFQILEKIM